MRFETNSEEETIELGMKLGSLLKGGSVVLLIGNLGAGKTAFSKGIGKGLGVKRVINSPTFTIVKEYQGDKYTFYHLDLYRLEGLNNDYDLDEYIESEDGICAIEWPNQVSELIPNEHITVNLEAFGNKRIINITSTPRYQEVVEAL